MPGPRLTSAGTFGTAVRIMSHGTPDDNVFLGNRRPSVSGGARAPARTEAPPRARRINK